MRLRDKVAIVTGAANGIGATIAEVFAEAGAWVLLADIDDEAGEQLASKLRNEGRSAEYRHVDITDAKQVAQSVDSVVHARGRIDALVNNAAYLTDWHDALNATQEEWERCVSVSLLGTHYFTREALKHMVAQKQGSIINISSVQGMVAARNSVAYTTVKAGLLGFTRSIAYDYGQHNVRCNAICPGAIRTRISPEPGSELHQRQISKTFLARIGDTRDVAYAALFLASDESAYITGAILPVDGGWTCM